MSFSELAAQPFITHDRPLLWWYNYDYDVIRLRRMTQCLAFFMCLICLIEFVPLQTATSGEKQKRSERQTITGLFIVPLILHKHTDTQKFKQNFCWAQISFYDGYVFPVGACWMHNSHTQKYKICHILIHFQSTNGDVFNFLLTFFFAPCTGNQHFQKKTKRQDQRNPNYLSGLFQE